MVYSEFTEQKRGYWSGIDLGIGLILVWKYWIWYRSDIEKKDHSSRLKKKQLVRLKKSSILSIRIDQDWFFSISDPQGALQQKNARSENTSSFKALSGVCLVAKHRNQICFGAECPNTWYMVGRAQGTDHVVFQTEAFATVLIRWHFGEEWMGRKARFFLSTMMPLGMLLSSHRVVSSASALLLILVFYSG